MIKYFFDKYDEFCGEDEAVWYAYNGSDVDARIAELEAQNQKLREQRDAANAQIQMLNRIIAGDVE